MPHREDHFSSRRQKRQDAANGGAWVAPVFQYVEKHERVCALWAEKGVEIGRFDITEQDAVAPRLGQRYGRRIEIDPPDTTAARSQRTGNGAGTRTDIEDPALRGYGQNRQRARVVDVVQI